MWIFKFGYTCWYHIYIFEKIELDYLMQNLMLKGLVPILNPKNEKAKISYAFWDQFN